MIRRIFVREDEDFNKCDFIMSPAFMFFWCGHKVSYFSLLDKFDENNLPMLNFRVKDQESKDVRIKEIRTGSDFSKIVLVV